MARATTKKAVRRVFTKTSTQLASKAPWSIHFGELKRGRGNPGKVSNLFSFIAEKIPYRFLSDVKRHMAKNKIKATGVYVAHDSMGWPRYIGRGDIFTRLAARKKAQVLELEYFSLYVIKDKVHEREIESMMIHVASPMLDFNERKKRVGIEAPKVKDFEAGTKFVERQYKRGRVSAIKTLS